MHCVGPEAAKTGVLWAQNAWSYMMHIANRVFCHDRIAEKRKKRWLLEVKGDINGGDYVGTKCMVLINAF